MDFIAVAYSIWALFMFALVALTGPLLIGKERKAKTFTVGYWLVLLIDTGLTAFLLWNAYL